MKSWNHHSVDRKTRWRLRWNYVSRGKRRLAEGQIQIEVTVPVIIISIKDSIECQEACLKLSRQHQWQLRWDAKIVTFLESVNQLRIKRTGYGQTESATGELMSFSGHTGYKSSHDQGVVLMLTKMPVSSRWMWGFWPKEQLDQDGRCPVRWHDPLLCPDE